MTYHDERWFNQTGKNLIRIVIGSYFAAVALGFAAGVNPTALFKAFLTPAMADLVGSTILLSAAIGFMLGAGLRLTALTLALFVFASTLVQNFVHFTPENVSGFWRDLAMICAVLSTYAYQSEQTQFAIVTPRPQPIRPRRVSISDRPERADQPAPGDAAIRPMMKAQDAKPAPQDPLILTHPKLDGKLAGQAG